MLKDKFFQISIIIFLSPGDARTGAQQLRELEEMQELPSGTERVRSGPGRKIRTRPRAREHKAGS